MAGEPGSHPHHLCLKKLGTLSCTLFQPPEGKTSLWAFYRLILGLCIFRPSAFCNLDIFLSMTITQESLLSEIHSFFYVSRFLFTSKSLVNMYVRIWIV